MVFAIIAVSQHRLFNEHLVSASSNPALALRRKKHTEKEVHADLISIVSVRLREGYSIREVNITKGDYSVFLVCFGQSMLPIVIRDMHYFLSAGCIFLSPIRDGLGHTRSH